MNKKGFVDLVLIGAAALVLVCGAVLWWSISQFHGGGLSSSTSQLSTTQNSPTSPSATTTTTSISHTTKTVATSTPAATKTTVTSKPPTTTATSEKTSTGAGYEEGTVPDSNSGGPTASFSYPSTFIVQTTSGNSISIDEKVPSNGAISFDQVAQIGISNAADSLDEALQNMIIPGANTAGAQTISFSTTSGLKGKEMQMTGTLFGNSVDYILVAIDSGNPTPFGSDYFITFSAAYNYGGGAGHGTYAGSDITAIKSIAESISL
jgi:hypothetical protein